MELAIDALEGEEVIILATTNDEFQSVLLDFQFNPEMLAFKEIIVSSELSNFYGTENLEEGRFRYGAFSSSSTQVSSEAYTLIFEARADLQSEIMLGDAFFDESPGDISLGESEQLQGDLNGDLSLNILDIVLVANIVLGNIDPTPAEWNAANVNGDGIVNILDIIAIINIILEN